MVPRGSSPRKTEQRRDDHREAELDRFRLRCSECGTDYPFDANATVCPTCAHNQESNRPLRGILEVERTADATVPDAPGLDPYDTLPVPRAFFPSIPVGNTPLWAPERLRSETGFSRLFVKDDTVNPTFSFKDRASFLVAAAARFIGEQNVTVASTGNAASSMAGDGAAAGRHGTTEDPSNEPRAKLVQCRR